MDSGKAAAWTTILFVPIGIAVTVLTVPQANEWFFRTFLHSQQSVSPGPPQVVPASSEKPIIGQTPNFNLPTRGQPHNTSQFSTGSNLIKNHNFVDGLAHWAVSQGTARYTVESTSGGQFIVEGVESNAQSLGRFYQDVSGVTTPGRDYVLSGWIRTQDVAGGGGVVIALDYVKSTGWSPPDGFVMEIGHVVGSNDWAYFQSKPFKLPPMPPDAASAWVLTDFNATTGTAWFADLGLTGTGPNN